MTKRITITLDNVEFKGRKCPPTKKDYRSKGSQTHVPKNKYNRSKEKSNWRNTIDYE